MATAWLVILVLIAANALYVAAEFAAVGVRRSQVQHRADGGDSRARRLLPWLLDAARLDRYVAACQVGITISSLVLGAVGQATLARDLAPRLAGLGGVESAAANSVSIVLVLAVLTVLQVILGELVPKSLALQYPTQTALYTVTPMHWSLSAFSWFIALLNGSGVAILRLLRVPYGGHRHIHSPEEIELLIAESRDGGLLEADESERLHEALQLSTRTAAELMVPRRHMVAVDRSDSLDDMLARVGEGPYTRVPVYDGSLDAVVGIVHARDLILGNLGDEVTTVADVMRPAVFVPESLTADRLLSVMREQRIHQAIVVDEFGGVEGLVTLEDVLTELLGEVGDEFQAAQPEPERLPDGRIRLPGRLHLDGVERWVGVPWRGASVTVGGYVTEALGRIAVPGDRLELDGVPVEVEAVESHAVASILATPREPSSGEQE